MFVAQLTRALLHAAFVATSDPATADAADARADQTVRVVAVADDVHSAVLREPDGELHRYAEGARLAPEWRLTRVANGVVTIGYMHAFNGSMLEIHLQVGESTDLYARSAALSGMQQPLARPNTRVTPIASKPKTKPPH
jgi:hypothetical protein